MCGWVVAASLKGYSGNVEKRLYFSTYELLSVSMQWSEGSEWNIESMDVCVELSCFMRRRHFSSWMSTYSDIHGVLFDVHCSATYCLFLVSPRCDAALHHPNSFTFTWLWCFFPVSFLCTFTSLEHSIAQIKKGNLKATRWRIATSCLQSHLLSEILKKSNILRLCFRFNSSLPQRMETFHLHAFFTPRIDEQKTNRWRENHFI